MKKEMLLKLRKLEATPAMMKLANEDKPEKKKIYQWSDQKCEVYKYGLYMRCQYLNGILKVSFFLANLMRLGLRSSVYDLFINKASGEFITYDHENKRWTEAKLDMLFWPEYVRHSGKWINNDGTNNIKRYLDVKNGGFKGLLDYQLQVRKDQLIRRHRRETDPWDLAMEQIPEKPKDWDKWVDKVGLTSNFIFYDYKKGGATEGYCSWCEKTVPVKQPKNNKTGKCSCCGHDIVYKSTGKVGNNFYTDTEVMYLLQRCEDGFVVREFSGYRHYRNGDYRKPEITYFERRRVIYNDQLYPSAYYYGEYKQMESRWMATNPASYYYSSNRGKVYGKTIPSLSQKELSRTGLPEMIKGIEKLDPESYLLALRYDKYLEQMAKAGLTRLAYDIVRRKIDLKVKFTGELHKMLGIDKQKLKRIRKNNSGHIFMEWMTYETKHKKNVPDEVIAWFEKEDIHPNNLNFISNNMSEVKIHNYLKCQIIVTGKKSRELITTWKDYLDMAKRLKMDANNELIYKPKNLVKSHNDIVLMIENKEAAIQAGEIAKKFSKVDNICIENKAKYEFEDENYAIVAPRGIEDIIVEGKILQHCMDKTDRYFDRINQRESYILFLRKKDDIKKPYYTLEVEPNGTIRQKRTLGDRQNPDIKEAAKFLEKWQKEIQKRLTKADQKLAESSKKMRIEGYRKLREDKVRVRGGIFAGELLADILEADLMEAEFSEKRCG
jgi:DNA-directed RNA polymerase subunit RPC12/RpoP